MTNFPSWCRVGQKVVCVDDDLQTGCEPGYEYTDSLDGLASSDIYTISAVYVSLLGEPCISVAEIVRPIRDDTLWHEEGFQVRRFRPLTKPTQEQDLEHFTDLLTTTKTAETLDQEAQIDARLADVDLAWQSGLAADWGGAL